MSTYYWAFAIPGREETVQPCERHTDISTRSTCASNDAFGGRIRRYPFSVLKKLHAVFIPTPSSKTCPCQNYFSFRPGGYRLRPNDRQYCTRVAVVASVNGPNDRQPWTVQRWGKFVAHKMSAGRRRVRPTERYIISPVASECESLFCTLLPNDRTPCLLQQWYVGAIQGDAKDC